VPTKVWTKNVTNGVSASRSLSSTGHGEITRLRQAEQPRFIRLLHAKTDAPASRVASSSSCRRHGSRERPPSPVTCPPPRRRNRIHA
jgi:hypothetical protein